MFYSQQVFTCTHESQNHTQLTGPWDGQKSLPTKPTTSGGHGQRSSRTAAMRSAQALNKNRLQALNEDFKVTLNHNPLDRPALAVTQLPELFT